MERNIAVVGSGYWGENLVRNFSQLDALHTVCDADSEKLEGLKAPYPKINVETDYFKVLGNEEIKGVVIATPAMLHYPMARKALLAGRDVFVEKPIALTVREARELVELAEEKTNLNG